MKSAILLTIILLAAPAAAKTVVIEYPDHFYVEMTGVPGAEPVTVQERNPLRFIDQPASGGGGTDAAQARPVTDFDTTPPPLDPEKRRALMTDAVQRLQRAREDTLTPRDGETPEQAGERERRAAGMLRKINRMSAELLKTP